MTLSLALFDPEKAENAYVECPELEGRTAAGFEIYRTELWGSLTMRRRTHRFFPVLRNADLFVFPHEMHCFKLECDSVWKHARAIADEIWPCEFMAKWCPIRRQDRIRSMRVRGAQSIRAYILRMSFTIKLAEQRNLGVSIS